LARRSVLVVEDNADIREAVIAYLEDWGLEARGAVHGRQALDLLGSAPDDQLPGVVVLDLMMPVMDGATFIESIRADPRLAKIPVVVISAFAPTTVPGAAAVLKKPFDPDALVDTVARFVGP
jgi:two-component system, chemotaxis family, chemotaxis protein CheY